MRYIYLTNNNGNNKGDILYLDENHFLVQYWQKRGIIKPYE